MQEIERDEPVWSIEATCTGEGWTQDDGRYPCYRSYRIEMPDIQYRKSTDYGGGTETSYGFSCPNCGCFTEIDNESLPKRLIHLCRPYVAPSSRRDEL